MVAEKKRITLEVDAGLQERLKAAAAAGRGVSVQEYCETALEKELSVGASAPGIVRQGWPLSRERLDAIRSLRHEIFRGRQLPGDSVDIIREEREKRAAHLDRVSRS